MNQKMSTQSDPLNPGRLTSLCRRTDPDTSPLDWRLGSTHEGPVLFIREDHETPGTPKDLHGLVLFMRSVGERHPVVFIAPATLD